MLLAPPPPTVTVEPGTLVVEWPDPATALDATRLPLAASPCILGTVLEAADGPLLVTSHRRTQEAVGPLHTFREVARALGAGHTRLPFVPGRRYALRLKVLTAHGCAAAAPVCFEARPTLPHAPRAPTARVATFVSGTARQAPHVRVSWQAPPRSGLPVDRYLLQAREASLDDLMATLEIAAVACGGDEAQSNRQWADVYLGVRTSFGDPATLRASAHEGKEYRVAAGNGLGWSHWSTPLVFHGDASVGSRVEALAEEPQAIFSETLLVPAVFGGAARRLLVTATPGGDKLVLASQGLQDQRRLRLRSGDLVAASGSDPAWAPNMPLQPTHAAAGAGLSGGAPKLLGWQRPTLRTATAAFSPARLRTVLERRLRVKAGGALAWAPLDEAGPRGVSGVEFADSAPWQLVVTFGPGGAAAAALEHRQLTRTAARLSWREAARLSLLEPRKLLLKVFSGGSGAVRVAATDFLADRTLTQSFSAAELRAAGLGLTTGEGLSEQAAMLFARRLAYNSGGAVLLLPRNASAAPPEASREASFNASPAVATWPFAAPASAEAAGAGDAGLASRVVSAAAQLTRGQVPEGVLRHAARAALAPPRLAPPRRSSRMRTLADVAAAEAALPSSSRALTLPRRVVDSIKGPLYSRPASRGTPGARPRTTDWPRMGARPQHSLASLARPIKAAAFDVTAGSATGGGGGRPVLLGQASAGHVYVAAAALVVTGAVEWRPRTPQLPPLSLQPLRWGPAVARGRTPTRLLAASGPQSGEELECDALWQS